jgi:hypothetical protein
VKSEKAGESDRALLDDLRELYEILDPPPPEVHSAARDALGWRTIDSDLAALIADSSLETSILRSSGGTRLLTFACERLTIEVELLAHPVGARGGRTRLLGQLVPVDAGGSITACGPGLSLTAAVDTVGCFSFDDLPDGPLSLRHQAPGATAVTTSWIVLP